MKMQILTATIAMVLAGTAAYAHHPAADIVDPEIYAMIDANVSDVHAEMVFDDMGRDLIDAGDAMNSREDMDAPMESRDDMGNENMARDEAGEVSADLRGPFEQTRNEDGAGDVEEVDTINLLEDVLVDLAE